MQNWKYFLGFDTGLSKNDNSLNIWENYLNILCKDLSVNQLNIFFEIFLSDDQTHLFMKLYNLYEYGALSPKTNVCHLANEQKGITDVNLTCSMFTLIFFVWWYIKIEYGCNHNKHIVTGILDDFNKRKIYIWAKNGERRKTDFDWFTRLLWPNVFPFKGWRLAWESQLFSICIVYVEVRKMMFDKNWIMTWFGWGIFFSTHELKNFIATTTYIN